MGGGRVLPRRVLVVSRGVGEGKGLGSGKAVELRSTSRHAALRRCWRAMEPAASPEMQGTDSTGLPSPGPASGGTSPQEVPTRGRKRKQKSDAGGTAHALRCVAAPDLSTSLERAILPLTRPPALPLDGALTCTHACARRQTEGGLLSRMRTGNQVRADRVHMRPVRTGLPHTRLWA